MVSSTTVGMSRIPTGGALRTSTTPTSVRVKWGLMAASTATTTVGVSTIPTGYLYANKNICRSPIISFNNNYAYLVELDGLVFNYNWDFGNSCGYF